MSQPKYVTINGTSYDLAKLSDAARSQVMNVQAADVEIARLQQQLAFMQTARNAYMNALLTEIKVKASAKMPAKASAIAAEKAAPAKKPRAPRKTAAKAS
ncbi:MAG: hypothetical protein V4724_26120 [Pseudomonadota bacterium]